MPWYPAAIRKPLPVGANDPPILAVGTVLHVAVSEAASLYDFFRTSSGGIESHGYIRRDGTVEQYRDTAYEADAQAAGNSFLVNGVRCGFISWETQGMGMGEWTLEQLAAIQNLIDWAVQEHPQHPFRVAPAWDQGGVGYHSMYGPWNPNQHACPGPDRIHQFKTIIAPWLAAGQDDDMPLTDADIRKLLNWNLTPSITVGEALIAATTTWQVKPWRAPDPVSTADAIQKTYGLVKTTPPGTSSLSENDKADIAVKVADLLSQRLQT